MTKSKLRWKERSMHVELLEHRALLAGDVTVTVIDGNLLIAGDHEGNEIAVASGELPGQVFVAGLPSSASTATTVNGMMGRVLFEGVRNNVMIRMGDGDDVVGIPHLRVAKNLGIRTGEGSDRVVVGMPPDPNHPDAPNGVAVRGAFHVATGAGNDVVIEHRAVVGRGHNIATGAGADEVMIGRPRNSAASPDRPALLAERAFVSLGEGNDVLRVHGAALGTAFGVASGTGEDTVRLDHVAAARTVRVSGGEDNDDIGISHVRAGRLALDTGGGHDRASITDAALGGLRVELGAGDDGLALGNTTVRGRAVLRGGRGEDTLVNLGGNRVRSLVVAGFENYRPPNEQSSRDQEVTDQLDFLL